MKTGTPFVVENFEDNAQKTDGNFEFTHNNIWNDSFYSPEISSANEFSLLQKDIADIKELIADIRDIIKHSLDN